MNTIHERTERLLAAKQRVLDHPMCGRLYDTPHNFVIHYPDMDFWCDGCRVERSADGLEKALVVMERHWLQSFPGFTS